MRLVYLTIIIYIIITNISITILLLIAVCIMTYLHLWCPSHRMSFALWCDSTSLSYEIIFSKFFIQKIVCCTLQISPNDC